MYDRVRRAKHNSETSHKKARQRFISVLISSVGTKEFDLELYRDYEILFSRMYEYACACLVILVIVIMYFVWQDKKYYYDSLMTGYWEGDETFLSQAGMDSISLYVGKNIGGAFGEKRRAYLIMTGNGNVVVQRIFYMSLSGTAGLFGSKVGKTITLRDDEEGSVETGPAEAGLDEPTSISIGKVMTDEPMDCDMNLALGLMSWSLEDKVYARFFRNFKDDVQDEAKAETDAGASAATSDTDAE